MEDKEIWKDILGYEGLYQVSNWGRVRNLRNNKITEGTEVKKRGKKGYKRFRLTKNGKTISIGVHRLVALHFIPFIPEPYKTLEDYQVNHRDEDKHNNRLDNLEFTTCKKNNNYGTRNIRHSKTIRGRVSRGDNPYSKKIICVETNTLYDCIADAADCLGVSQSAISHHLRGNSKTCGGYHWRYYED